MQFLAHAQMRPLEGGDVFTIEHEFSAETWHRAWEHVMALGRQFEATVVWHRIVPVNPATGELIQTDAVQSPIAVVPPTTPRVIPALPAPAPAVVVKEKVPDWLGLAEVTFPIPEPWPETLTVNVMGV